LTLYGDDKGVEHIYPYFPGKTCRFYAPFRQVAPVDGRALYRKTPDFIIQRNNLNDLDRRWHW
jgi:hypothetical protein